MLCMCYHVRLLSLQNFPFALAYDRDKGAAVFSSAGKSSSSAVFTTDSPDTTYISFIIVFEADEWLITCVLTEH